jgi:diguanylate cyclase (GGDEF)-like protein
VETGRDGAQRYAERIRRQIEVSTFGHGRPVTVSLGVACVPDDVGPSIEDVVTVADWALYDAKRAGRNQVAGRDGAVAIDRGRRGGWDL